MNFNAEELAADKRRQARICDFLRRSAANSSALPHWFGDRDNLLLFILIVLHLIPIWSFRYFPSQDGPSHLQNAGILLDYGKPEWEILRQYYVFNSANTPNWFFHLSLAGLMLIFPALIAEKIVLTGYILLLPISARYALNSIDPKSKFLTVLIAPFIYNALFQYGFYTFSYSLAVYFFTLGYWIRNRDCFNAKKTFKLTLLTTLLYWTHPTSLIAAAVAIGFLIAAQALIDLRNAIAKGDTISNSLRSLLPTSAIPSLIAFTPPMILVGIFLSKYGTETSSPLEFDRAFYKVLSMSLNSFNSFEIKITALIWLILAIAIIGVSAVKFIRRRWHPLDALLPLSGIYIFMSFTTPAGFATGTFLIDRLVFYIFFALILWFGTHSFLRNGRIIIRAVGCAFVLVMLCLRISDYAKMNDYLEEYLSGAGLIESKKTILPLCYSRRLLPENKVLSDRISPIFHAAGYIAAQRGAVELANYEADSGHFPTLYRPELNPFEKIGIRERKGGESTLQTDNPKVDFSTYEERTGGRVDYVLLWGFAERDKAEGNASDIYHQLDEGYELIYTSKQRGLMRLYKRR